MTAGFIEFPNNSVIIRFGVTTPYFLMTLSYGIFYEPSLRVHFTSLDAWLGYHMFVQPADRKEVMRAPNGYIANRNVEAILSRSTSTLGSEVVSPTWTEDRDRVLFEGAALKYTQSSCLRDMLLRTGDRPLVDASRDHEHHWCFCDGKGANTHGRILEKLRMQLRAGEANPQWGNGVEA